MQLLTPSLRALFAKQSSAFNVFWIAAPYKKHKIRNNEISSYNKMPTSKQFTYFDRVML